MLKEPIGSQPKQAFLQYGVLKNKPVAFTDLMAFLNLHFWNFTSHGSNNFRFYVSLKSFYCLWLMCFHSRDNIVPVRHFWQNQFVFLSCCFLCWAKYINGGALASKLNIRIIFPVLQHGHASTSKLSLVFIISFVVGTTKF